jgi:down-regulator of transcription 1
VNKFANEVASSLDVRLTMDTRELIADCCSEFVQLLSSEANEVCEKDAKKTITPEHVLRALQQLGFERYFTEVAEEYERVKADDRGRTRDRARKDRKKGGVPTEELLALQEALFAKAREDPMNLGDGGGGAGDGPTPPTAE